MSSAPCATACFAHWAGIDGFNISHPNGKFPGTTSTQGRALDAKSYVMLVPKRVDPEYWVN